MERNSYSVSFIVRESRQLKNGESPIECRITIKGKRATLNTIGNNPMIGCNVACAVDIATALNK